jgi:hypothetical protein
VAAIAERGFSERAGKDGEAGIFAGYVDAAGRRWPMPQPARDATKILKTL